MPPEAAELMYPAVNGAAEKMIAAILLEVPEFARPQDECYAAAVRQAVGQALGQFVQLVADPDAPRDETAKVFREIGRVEAAAGRSLEPVQAALRLGARVAWRTLNETPGSSRLGTDVLARVGEAIFLYLDELADACAEGFTLARAEVVGETELRRRRLLDLVVADPPVSAQAIAELARAAGWQLPRKIAAVALADRSQEHGPPPALPPDVLIDLARPGPCALVPDPDGPGRADLIDRSLRGWTAALGPAVPLAQAASSLRWARQALALARRGIIRSDRSVTRCDEHLGTLLMFSDEDLVLGLAGARLAPLSRLRPSQRDTLAETLLSWLQNSGNARETARQLHVHPQTVRYRLRQIHEMFGADLLEPDVRFELEIALRARQLLRCNAAPPVLGTAANEGLVP
jgi:PucR-like helix-turn-helix protein